MLPTPLLHAALPLSNPITTLSIHPDYQKKNFFFHRPQAKLGPLAAHAGF
jgi:hypothetical protein